MPSMRKLFRSSKQTKSCSSLGGSGDELISIPSEAFTAAAPPKPSLTGLPGKKKEEGFGRRPSLGDRKPGKVLGRSLRNLLTRRSSLTSSSKSNKTDESATFNVEDTSDHLSTTDTVLSLTPPSTPDKMEANASKLVKISPVVLERLEEVSEEAAAAAVIDQSKIKEEAAYYPEVWRSLGFKNTEAGYPQVGQSLGIIKAPEEKPLAYYPAVWSSLEFKDTAAELPEEECATNPVVEVVVPEPPQVARNEDLLELWNESNILKADGEEDLTAFLNDSIVDRALEAILESDDETEVMKNLGEVASEEEETASETASESADESATEAITAAKTRDSVMIVRESQKIKSTTPTSGRSWSGVFVALVVRAAVAGLVFVLANGEMPTKVGEFFSMSNLELPSVDLSALKSIEIPEEWKVRDLKALNWTQLQAELPSLLGQETPVEEVVRPAAPSGCYGMYCGF